MQPVGASYEFLEAVAICRGDSFNEENNLTHAEAVEQARLFLNTERNKNMNIIRGKLIQPQKICIYGESGVGKTTLGAQFGNALIIDAERSSTHQDVPRVFIDNWEQLLSTIQEACTLAEFETIILDTVDWAELKCAEYICAKFKKNGIEEFGYGKGYTYLEEEFRKLIKLCDNLIQAGKNVVFLAHQTLRKIEPADEGTAFDRYEPKLSKKINPLVCEWVDALLFMFRKTYVETKDNGKGKVSGGKKRVINANSASFCLSKNRWNGLEDEFDADISQILPYLPKGQVKAPVPAPTPKEETPQFDDVVRAAHDKLRDLLAMGQYSEVELLAYLYGKNAKGNQFIPAGTAFKDIPESLIDRMTESDNWARIEQSLEANRNN